MNDIVLIDDTHEKVNAKVGSLNIDPKSRNDLA